MTQQLWPWRSCGAHTWLPAGEGSSQRKTPLWCVSKCFLVVSEHSLGTWDSKPLLGRVTTSPFPVLAPRILHPRNWDVWSPYLLGFWNQEDRVQLWLCHFLAVLPRQSQLASQFAHLQNQKNVALLPEPEAGLMLLFTVRYNHINKDLAHYQEHLR